MHPLEVGFNYKIEQTVIDVKNDDFVAFDRTQVLHNDDEEFHGHVRCWCDLHNDQKSTLRKTGKVSNSADKTEHGGSTWQLLSESRSSVTLDWMADLNEYGDVMKGKHKGSTGRSVNLNKLKCQDKK